MITLRPEQRTAVDAAKAILSEKKVVYLAAEVRTGKNFMSFSIAMESGWKRVCFITKKLALIGVNKDYEAFGKPFIAFHATNFEQAKNLIDEYDGYIIDEAHACFPAGTLVDGIKIEDIKVGNSLRSYSFEDGREELRVVVNTFSLDNNDGWVRVRVNGKNIICTPDHLFFSKRGWIHAKEITINDELFTVQQALDGASNT